MKNNIIYLADVFDFLTKLDDNIIDLAIVDPPYNMHKTTWDTFKTEEEYFNFTFAWLDILVDKIKNTGSLYLFNNAYNSAVILNYLRNKKLIFKNWITWYKKDGFCATHKKYVNSQETILFYTKTNSYTFNYNEIRQPYESTDRLKYAKDKGILKNGKRWFPNEKGKLCNDVWQITSQRHKEKVNGKIQKPLHPTIKPNELIERIIKASSNENDLILDLFSGSASASKMAMKLNRNFIGCENNLDYIKINTEEKINYEQL